MIDIKNINYRAVLVTKNGTHLVLNEMLQSLSWEENPGELAQRSSFLFKNDMYKGTGLQSYAELGGHIFIYSDWGGGAKEVFRGPLWNYNYESATNKDLTLTAYDNFIYTQKSKDYKWYAAGTGSKKIILDIFSSWGIPLGTYEGPNVALGKEVFKNQYLSDMILKILDDAKKKGAGKYNIRSSYGKAYVLKRGSNKMVYKFEGDNSILAGVQIDMDDLITRVKIIGKEENDERAPVEAIVNGKTEFGILQDIVQRSQDDTLAAAKSSANEILKECGTPKITRNIQAPDLPFLRKGDKVFLKAGALNGYFYITGIQHDATSRSMTMEVEE